MNFSRLTYFEVLFYNNKKTVERFTLCTTHHLPCTERKFEMACCKNPPVNWTGNIFLSVFAVRIVPRSRIMLLNLDSFHVHSKLPSVENFRQNAIFEVFCEKTILSLAPVDSDEFWSDKIDLCFKCKKIGGARFFPSCRPLLEHLHTSCFFTFPAISRLVNSMSKIRWLELFTVS